MGRSLRRAVRITAGVATAGVALGVLLLAAPLEPLQVRLDRPTRSGSTKASAPDVRGVLARRGAPTKAVVELDGYPFYPEPPGAWTRRTPRACPCCSAIRPRTTCGGPAQLRGGFPPPPGLRDRVARRGSCYRALVCLGCGEFKLSGPWVGWRYGMDEATTREALREFLKGYQKYRPKSGHHR